MAYTLMTLAAGVAVCALLVLWSGGGRLRHSIWPAVAVLVYAGFNLIRGAAGNIREPREWDYACFWLYGHIATRHLNVYDPAIYASIRSPFTPTDGFRLAVLNVGFPYPPPSIALFWPLGFIDSVPVGLTLWYAAGFAALAGAAWLLARTFIPAQGWRSALLILALIAALPAAQMNVNTAQTNFILLLLVALALRARRTRAGAIWTMLAIWVKPYAAVLLLLDLIRGRWGRLLVAAGTAVLSFIAAALLLGPATLASYLRANPSGREPTYAYVEPVNQSLLAVVLRLRLHHASPAHISALHEPLFIAGALVFAGLTIALCLRAPAATDLGLAAMLLLGLIVYPGSLSSYGVVLIVPVLVVWRHRDAFPGRDAAVVPIVFLAVALQNIERGFEGNVLLWAACAYLLARARGPVRGEDRVAASPPAGSAALAG